MKKILFVLLSICSAAYGQDSLFNAQTIGQPSRNQKVGNGLDVVDTLFLRGKVRLPVMTTVGGATDSILSVDPVTRIVELRPQGGGTIDTTNFWNIRGNTGTSATTNFAGTTDSVDFVLRSKNLKYAKLKAWGALKLSTNDSLRYDSAATFTQQVQTGNALIGDDSIGYRIPQTTNATDTSTSYNNTIVGLFSGHQITNAWGNSFFGAGIAPYLTGVWGSASHNPGTPYGRGYENSLFGLVSGHKMRTGYENSAFGTLTLFHCDSCIDQSAFGLNALHSSNAQLPNDAFGVNTLMDLTTGTGNSAFGSGAGANTTTATNNTFIGSGAGGANITGFSNVYVGTQAGVSATSSGNIVMGINAGLLMTSGAENLIIGEVGGDNVTTQSNQVFIGKGYVHATYALDTTNTWLYGVDLQSTATNRIRLNGQAIFAKGINFSEMTVNTTSGDAATINAVTGSFRKDASGTTFTLTNSYITANSKLLLQIETVGLTTGGDVRYSCGGGFCNNYFSGRRRSDCPQCGCRCYLYGN